MITKEFKMPVKTELSSRELPAEVQQVLLAYVDLLRNSASLEEAASAFVSIAGGALVNENDMDISLRSTVKEFGLKKDYQAIQMYAYPIEITRIQCMEQRTTVGYGASAITGQSYKIWLKKANPDVGLPAPVTLLVPEHHPTIQLPKIINIGSF